MAEIRFQLDEHVPAAVATGLRRLRIEAVTTGEINLVGATDVEQIQVALDAGRVIVSFDPDFVDLHYAGVRHAGIVHVRSPRNKAPGRLIEILRLVAESYDTDDMIGRLEPF
ncbi:MAG: DUF5615 family PIN-like protein [Chloroflexota bacterium]